ncbi:MAG: hypothetical protein GY943_25985, partial [Chloroflexi bacterium]|nr:hypothetical protein [Chloroflexota bacterium]
MYLNNGLQICDVTGVTAVTYQKRSAKALHHEQLTQNVSPERTETDGFNDTAQQVGRLTQNVSPERTETAVPGELRWFTTMLTQNVSPERTE